MNKVDVVVRLEEIFKDDLLEFLETDGRNSPRSSLLVIRVARRIVNGDPNWTAHLINLYDQLGKEGDQRAEEVDKMLDSVLKNKDMRF